MGCYFDNCGSSSPARESTSPLQLDLVSKFDTISVLYLSEATGIEKIPIRESTDLGLTDTIRIVFHGRETYFRRRVLNQIVIIDDSIRVRHVEQDSVGVFYTGTSRDIEVLKKTACTPAMGGFVTDSIVISHSPIKKVVFKAKSG